jgi:hypothetical protein
MCNVKYDTIVFERSNFTSLSGASVTQKMTTDNLIRNAHLSLHSQLLFQVPDLKFELRSTTGKIGPGLLFGGKLGFLNAEFGISHWKQGGIYSSMN